VEPGAETRPGRIEGRRATGHGDPGLLVKVFGGLAVGGAQRAADEHETHAVVAVVELAKGVSVAAGVGGQQLRVVGGRVVLQGWAQRRHGRYRGSLAVVRRVGNIAPSMRLRRESPGPMLIAAPAGNHAA